ncbi:hypothetical protein Hanom_Chr03g00208221 [Helianthus anomalus]
MFVIWIFIFAQKPVSPTYAEPSSAVNDDLPPSSPHASIREQLRSTKAVENEAEKIAEAENPEVEKAVEVGSEKVVDLETADVDVIHPKSPEVEAHDPEKGKSAQEDHVATFPTAAFVSALVNIERSPTGDQGSFTQVDENSPIRPDETLGNYYYRCYSEKKADEIHAPWYVAGWKRKAEAEAALLSEERKRLREICEKGNNEKIGLRNVISNLKAEVERLKKQDANLEKLKQEKADAEAVRDEARSHRERNEQREV